MKVDLQWQGLVLLLIFVAPGFLFSRSYTAFRPRYYRTPDVLEQIVLSVVASTLIHALFMGILALLALAYWAYWNLRGWPPLLRDVLVIPLRDYPLWMLTVNALIAVAYLLLSLVFAYRAGAFLGRLSAEGVPHWLRWILGRIPPDSVLLWHTVLQEEPIKRGVFPPRLVTWLRSSVA
jgi:amino acid transporter